MNMRTGYIYNISNTGRTTLYVGVTNSIERRILEHKAGLGCIFSKRYKIVDLLYYEDFGNISHAIKREKQLKNWHRDWKWNLIKEDNPQLIDLAADWYSKEEIDEFKANQNYINLGS